MIVSGVGDGERQLAVKENVGKEVDKFQKPLRNKAPNQAHQKRVSRYFDDFRLQGHAEETFFRQLRIDPGRSVGVRQVGHQRLPSIDRATAVSTYLRGKSFKISRS